MIYLALIATFFAASYGEDRKPRCYVCTINDDCGNGDVCVEDLIGGNFCAKCADDSDCGDRVCDNNMCQDCAEDRGCGDDFCDTSSSNHTCVQCYEDSQCTTNICRTDIQGQNFCGACRTDQDCEDNVPTTFCYDGECEFRCDDAMNFTGGVNDDGDCTAVNRDGIAGECDVNRSPVCIYDYCPNGNSDCTGITDSYDLPYICDDSRIRNGFVDCEIQNPMTALDGPITYCLAVYATNNDQEEVYANDYGCGEMYCDDSTPCSSYNAEFTAANETNIFITCIYNYNGEDDGICVETCTGKASSYCAGLAGDDAYSCNTDECTMQACPNGDSDCSTDYKCNSNGMCTPECSDNGDCRNTGEWCQLNTTSTCEIDTCTTSVDCEHGEYVCDTSAGECIEACSDNQYCIDMFDGIDPRAGYYECNDVSGLCEYVPRECNYTTWTETPFYCTNQDPRWLNGTEPLWRCGPNDECIMSDNCDWHVDNDPDLWCTDTYGDGSYPWTCDGCDSHGVCTGSDGFCEPKYPCDINGCGWAVDMLQSFGNICPNFPYEIPCDAESKLCNFDDGPQMCTEDANCDTGRGYVCSKMRKPEEDLIGVCVEECSSDTDCKGLFCADDDEDGECDDGPNGLVCKYGQCSIDDENQCYSDTAADCEAYPLSSECCAATESGVTPECIEPGFMASFCAVRCDDNGAQDCIDAYEKDCSNAESILCFDSSAFGGTGSFCSIGQIVYEGQVYPQAFVCETHAPTSAPVMTTTEIAGNTESMDGEGANELTIFVVVGVVAAIKLFM